MDKSLSIKKYKVIEKNKYYADATYLRMKSKIINCIISVQQIWRQNK